jgi:hypothetical protein
MESSEADAAAMGGNFGPIIPVTVFLSGLCFIAISWQK